MADFTLSYTGTQINTLLAKIDNLLNNIYPVGSIYMSVNSTNPGTLFGGTWQQIQDTFLLAAGTTYAGGATGGEASHTLVEEEVPAHTHTRGTMNITGTHHNGWGDSSAGMYILNTADGAFYGYNDGKSVCWSANTTTNAASSYANATGFDASRSWSGATSSYGGSSSHNNMPPYLAVYVWKRTA